MSLRKLDQVIVERLENHNEWLSALQERMDKLDPNNQQRLGDLDGGNTPSQAGERIVFTGPMLTLSDVDELMARRARRAGVVSGADLMSRDVVSSKAMIGLAGPLREIEDSLTVIGMSVSRLKHRINRLDQLDD